MITLKDIRKVVRDLDLTGQPLCLHSSLRSFGWVEGGPLAVVNGFLSEGCTVIVPTFSYSFAVPPPQDIRPARNGWNYDTFDGPTSGTGRVFTPDSVEIDKDDMGVVPATIVAMPGRVRGNHPLDSFSAVGPRANELIYEQMPLNVYAPLKALAEAKGSIVLIGVGLDKLTLLHLAEQKAGRNLFIRWANDHDHRPMAVEAGGCSDGFVNFESILSPLVKGGKIGRSVWRVYPAKEVLEVAARIIRENPELTHCSDPQCERCNDAALGGPIIFD